jgi:internalin A
MAKTFLEWLKTALGLGVPEASDNSSQTAARQPKIATQPSEPKGFVEANRRIAAWQNKKNAKKKEKTLLLTSLKLTTLPPGIASLTQLGQLNLSDNMLGDDACKTLAHLTNLTWLFLTKNQVGPEGAKELASLSVLGTLDLGGNKIGDNGARELAKLPAIKKLRLESNQIGAEGAKALASLTHLKSLGLRNNNIGDEGASALKALTQLLKLDLGGNRIGPEGAMALATLVALRRLDLSGNQIGSEGAAGLSSLTSLTALDLSNSGIEDLAFIHGLTALTTISLNGLRLKNTEADILRRGTLEKVYLHQAQLGDVPPELLSKHPFDNCLPRLRAYFNAQEEDAKEPDIVVRDVKVMILGNGLVGKTQMRRRLSGLQFDRNVPTTHGVEIVTAELPPAPDAPADSEATPLRIWDFGGQDIYLGTHALFLKTRAVFPILWTPKSEDNETHEVDGHFFRNYPLTEWVRFVLRLAGEKSPVLLVQSQCESPAARRAPPVAQALIQEFGYRPRELHYSAMPGQTQERLLIELRDAVAWLASDGPTRISARWAKVKAAIEVLVAEKEKKSITREEFDEICETHEVANPNQRTVLLGLLHQFGTVFHDPELLRDLIILDQNWALQAIYALFDRHAGAFDTIYGRWKGRFTRSDLGALIWDARHTQADQESFIAMMVSCRVAFPLRRATEQDNETLYIAPDLLPERATVQGEIAARFQEDQPDATCEIPFAFAVPSLLRELMGTWGADAGQHGLYWRDGLSFYDQGTRSRALIEALRPEDRSWRATIRVKTWTGEATTLMERLRARVLETGERFGAQVEPEHESALLSTSDDEDEDEDEEEARQGGASEQSPLPILPGPIPLAPERCFISYAHGDETEAGKMRSAAFDAVKTRLLAIDLEPFFDTQNLRHGESITAFMGLGAQARKFVIILSNKYLYAPFCMNELLRIWRACGSDENQFRSRVRVVCLPDAKIDTMQQQEIVSRHWSHVSNETAVIIQERITQKLDVPPEHSDTLRVAVALNQQAPAILSCIAGSLYIRSISDIELLTFL